MEQIPEGSYCRATNSFFTKGKWVNLDGWISVKDRLPTLSGPYFTIVTVKPYSDRYVNISYFNDGKFSSQYSKNGVITCPVAHYWREIELPELPKKLSDDTDNDQSLFIGTSII